MKAILEQSELAKCRSRAAQIVDSMRSHPSARRERAEEERRRVEKFYKKVQSRTVLERHA